jgi:hypothetical protein
MGVNFVQLIKCFESLVSLLTNIFIFDTFPMPYNLRGIVTHDFGHSGDVSTSDVFRLPQGLFA